MFKVGDVLKEKDSNRIGIYTILKIEDEWIYYSFNNGLNITRGVATVNVVKNCLTLATPKKKCISETDYLDAFKENFKDGV